MPFLERVTKPVVIISALWVAGLLVSTPIEWPNLRWVALAAFFGSFVAARRFPRATMQVWLLCTYVAPGVLTLLLGEFRYWDLTPWLLGLLGTILATTDPTRWQLPVPWRVPLVVSLLVVTLSWPVIWLRELDFLPDIVGLADVVNNGAGVPPDIGTLWAFWVVLVHAIGVLWFDWLTHTYPRVELKALLRQVILPLACSFGIGLLMAGYQATVDIGTLNQGFWAEMRRASGLLMDANPFGMAAALWGGFGVALLIAWPGRDRTLTPGLAAVAGGVLLMSWYGLWVSGSRSALLAGTVVVTCVLRRLMPSLLCLRGGRRLVITALVVLLAGGFAVSRSSLVGPWQRAMAEAPTASVASVRAFLVELWERNNYGAAAVHMIADSPMVGVGVGAYHLLVPDVGHEHQLGRIEPDNAQNWWRHQIAELGVLGALGWLWFSVLLGLHVLTARASPGMEHSAALLRGVLLAIAAVSLLGMPTQNPALTLTFWTAVGWFGCLVPVPAGVGWGNARIWVVAWGLVVVYLGAFATESWTHLRPPHRANRADWNYSYGMYHPDPHPDGGTFQWTGTRGLTVVPLTDRWIEVSAWTHHPDIGERPVSLQVSVDGTPLIESVRSTGEPVVGSVRIPENRLRVTIEVQVDRTWSPADHGEADTRELGAGFRWRFFDPNPED